MDTFKKSLCHRSCGYSLSSVRFSGPLDVDLLDLSSNLVPYRGLHFLVSALAPLEPQPRQQYLHGSLSQAGNRGSLPTGPTRNQIAPRCVDMLLDILSPSHQLLDIRPKAST